MKACLLGFAAIGALASGTAARAQEAGVVAAPAQEAGTAAPVADDGQIDADIVVTAQKRSESIQKVPIAITAVGAETIQSARIETLFDMVKVAPSLRLDNGIQAAKARIIIRGIGSSGGTAVEPSVATFLDGVYIPREGAAIAAYLDLQAIEVLRGPQGTLFGRNASAGAISLRSAAPTDRFEGSVSAEVGTGERYKLNAVINAPLSDRVALRLAGQAEYFDGLYRNKLTGRRLGGADTYIGRASLKAELTSNLTATIRAFGHSRKGDGFGPYALLPDTFPPGRLQVYLARFAAIGDTNVDLKPFDRTVNEYDANSLDDRQWGLSNDISWDGPGGFTVRLLGGYANWKSDQVGVNTFSATVPIVDQTVRWRSESISQELQLISPQTLLDDRLSFVAGLYYLNEKYKFNESWVIGPAGCNLIFVSLPAAIYNSCLAGSRSRAFNIDFAQTTESLAGYGQATLAIFDRLKLVGGIRWTDDSKDGSVDQVAFNLAGALVAGNERSALKLHDSRVTWRAGLNWEPTRDVLVFGSYSTGFKSGGFNSNASSTALGNLRIFRPETAKSLELGVKSSWLNRAATINITAFQMEVTDLQERSYNGQTYSVLNAGAIRNRGVEVETRLRPAPILQFTANFAYLDSKFTSYLNAAPLPGTTARRNLTGARPTFSPEFSGNIGVELQDDFRNGMGWQLRTDATFTSDENVGLNNDANPQNDQDGFSLVSARATLYGRNRTWSLSAFGENLFNHGYCTSKAYQPFGAQLGAVTPGISPLRCNVVGRPRTIGASVGFNF